MKKQFILLLVLSLLCGNTINFAQEKSINNDSLKKKSNIQVNEIRYNEAEHASIYELVVIGSVIDIRGTPASMREMFHSEIIIKIDSVVKGKVNYRNIVIKLQSGPVTDDPHGDRIICSIEPIFKIGEQSVFFLNPAKSDAYLNSAFAKKTYKKFNGKNSISELADSTFWVATDQTFKVKNGMVNYFGEQKNKNSFIQKILSKISNDSN